MGAKVRVFLNEKVAIEAEGDTHLDIFQQIADLSEAFDNCKCGQCGGTDVRFFIREATDKDGDTHKYPEIRCMNRQCRAKLSFGTHKKTFSLYPKRYQVDDKGKQIKGANGWGIPVGKNGWVIFRKEEQQNESPKGNNNQEESPDNSGDEGVPF